LQRRPLGFAARRWCIEARTASRRSYHTQFPQYSCAQRLADPLNCLLCDAAPVSLLAAHSCMISTQGVHAELTARGFIILCAGGEASNTQLFRPASQGIFGPATTDSRFMWDASRSKKKCLRFPSGCGGAAQSLVVGDGPSEAPASNRNDRKHMREGTITLYSIVYR